MSSASKDSCASTVPHVSSLFQDTCSFSYFSKVESLSKSYGGLPPMLSTAADFWRPPVFSCTCLNRSCCLSRQPSEHRVFIRKYPAYFLFQGWPQNSDLPSHFTDRILNQSIRLMVCRRRLLQALTRWRLLWPLPLSMPWWSVSPSDLSTTLR